MKLLASTIILLVSMLGGSLASTCDGTVNNCWYAIVVSYDHSTMTTSYVLTTSSTNGFSNDDSGLQDAYVSALAASSASSVPYPYNTFIDLPGYSNTNPMSYYSPTNMVSWAQTQINTNTSVDWTLVETTYTNFCTGSCGNGYYGPGDIVSGATVFYSLRAYTQSYAASSPAVNVRRSSDNSTQDIGFASGWGILDASGAITFAGTDATCTGSISGTTLSVSSCSSGTLHVYDVVYDSGPTILSGTYITSIGSCASPPGTCTVSKSQTVSSETVTAQSALYVTKWYDQSGNGYDAVQSTNADQPLLFLNNGQCFSAIFPCIFFPSTSQTLTASGTIGSFALGQYAIEVGRWPSAFTSTQLSEMCHSQYGTFPISSTPC